MSTKIYDIIDTENGVKFHVNRMEDNLLIDDINVKPGIKTVKFDFGDIRFMVAIAGGKSFPDVDTLIIGSKIDNISIPNDLFPNIKRVISYRIRRSLSSNFMIKMENILYLNIMKLNFYLMRFAKTKIQPLT